MKKAKKPARTRTVRREQERQARAELSERERGLREQILERERAAMLRPGGSPERPIEVASVAVIELRAEAQPCLHCDAHPRIEAHSAEKIADRSLRKLSLRCPRCHASRVLWFALTPSLMN